LFIYLLNIIFLLNTQWPHKKKLIWRRVRRQKNIFNFYFSWASFKNKIPIYISNEKNCFNISNHSNTLYIYFVLLTIFLQLFVKIIFYSLMYYTHELNDNVTSLKYIIIMINKQTNTIDVKNKVRSDPFSNTK